ncbi:MAG: hypothetical protein ACI86L_001613 [Dokdonia sp.]|jgi:hypothetical protein
MTALDIKKELLKQCAHQLGTRRAAVDQILANVALSLKEETKSSAGDKHETGRAMLQLERENAGKQLAEIEKVEAILKRLRPDISQGPAHLGCVVATSQAKYYLSIPSGALNVDDHLYYAIGLGSPIGQLLLGKKEGDVVRFRESELRIQNIY